MAPHLGHGACPPRPPGRGARVWMACTWLPRSLLRQLVNVGSQPLPHGPRPGDEVCPAQSVAPSIFGTCIPPVHTHLHRGRARQREHGHLTLVRGGVVSLRLGPNATSTQKSPHDTILEDESLGLRGVKAVGVALHRHSCIRQVLRNVVIKTSSRESRKTTEQHTLQCG